MKHVVIFNKDEYDSICYLVHDAFECAIHCPKTFYTNEVVDKLDLVQKMLKKEEK